MGKTKLFIRPNDINRQGQCVIYIRYSAHDKSVDFSTNQLIEPKLWDKRSQQVRKTYKGAGGLNNYLAKRKIEIETIKLKLETEGKSIDVLSIKREFLKNAAPATPPVVNKGMLELWPKFVEVKFKSLRISSGTVKQYKTTLENLQSFERFTGAVLQFEMIDNRFYEQYLCYLFDHLNYSPSSAGNKIKQLKCFLAWAVDNEETTHHKFKKFKKPSNESFSIALNEEELNNIVQLQLVPGSNLEKSRDLFVLACSSGLRLSDFKELKLANIEPDFISKYINKTKESVRIPLNAYSRLILAKYPLGLPAAPATINKDLKQIGKKSGLSRMIEVTTYPGGRVKKVYVEMWRKLSSHCGRRTFATQSIARGMALSDVAKLTGHKDLKVFMRYIKYREARLQSEMEKAWNTLPTLKENLQGNGAVESPSKESSQAQY